jgi:rubrerythrin
MKALKGTQTHDNLKAAFAGESQANRRYLYFAAKADCSARPRKARPATRMATSSTWKPWATRRPTCRSAARART